MNGRNVKSEKIEIHHLADHPELIPRIARWIFDEWPFLFPGNTSRNVELLLQDRLHKKKLPLTLIAFMAGKPVGTVSLKEFDIETRRDLSPWLTSLYVVERWRGRGIGSRLMKAAEEKAARLGFKNLFLLTVDSDLAARFYGRSGWKVREKPVHGGYRIIIMEKELAIDGKQAA